jgi:hypothetical protein
MIPWYLELHRLRRFSPGTVRQTNFATEIQGGTFMQFFKQLLGRFCPHRFSWPHSGAHGLDYQVCLICGAAYEYDWSTMRRTHLLPPRDVQAASERRSSPGH